jgi:hypothetical protein
VLVSRLTAWAVATSLAALVSGGSEAALAASREYQAAYEVGLRAYRYGLPLVTTNQTFLTMTSTDVSQGSYGPVNTFNSVRSPNNAASTTVVAPGATSLSSIAWLDLSSQPQVVHVPRVTGHYFVLALIDPYTTNIVNLGTASSTPPGDYVVCDPAQRNVPLPAGTTRLNVDYSRIWIIGSTQLKGARDIPAVNAIQDQYTLTPLDAYASAPIPSIPAPSPGPLSPSITEYPAPTGLAYFDLMGQLMAQFPPSRKDSRALRDFSSVGIGPGLRPSQDSRLSADTLAGLTAAAAAGPARVRQDTKALYAADFARHNGYLLGGFGRYSARYTERAVISQIGLGAFTPRQAIYAMAWSDQSTSPLNGSHRYVLHMPAPPPTTEGWSLTVYNLQGGLMANPLNRFAFTNTSTLARNSDGSIDFYLQASPPARSSHRTNWLPVTPGQGFEVTWRLFAPRPSATPSILDGSGWQPPTIRSQP